MTFYLEQLNNYLTNDWQGEELQFEVKSSHEEFVRRGLPDKVDFNFVPYGENFSKLIIRGKNA